MHFVCVCARMKYLVYTVMLQSCKSFTASEGVLHFLIGLTSKLLLSSKAGGIAHFMRVVTKARDTYKMWASCFHGWNESS